MLDFMMVSTRSTKRGTVEIYPKFIVKSSTDLMTRGGDFYAVWNEKDHLWSTSEEVALYLIDQELDAYAENRKAESEDHLKVMHMWDSDTGMIDHWHKFVQKQMLKNSFHQLDEKLIFSNTDARKEDYASRRLDYPFEEGSIASYEEMMNTLYSPEERNKIEWAIGAIISGDSKDIQKFMVMYGPPGSGKSTVLNIIQDLFAGYFCVFDAKALGSASNAFALEAFKSNPLVAIQHDGDLSKIEDNTRLNSLVSHEYMMVNEKFKSVYSNRFNCFLFMGTNKPVKISDAKSGIIRRLIDVSPTGNTIPAGRYDILKSKIHFELGGIAWHCLQVYEQNPGRYNHYIPTSMIGASNDFYNFVLEYYDEFSKEDSTTLGVAYERYLKYFNDANLPYKMSMRIFKEELKSYFREFHERLTLEDGTRMRNYYKGFIFDKFTYYSNTNPPEKKPLLELDYTESVFDDICANCPAQYTTEEGTPRQKWVNVETKLSDIDTTKLHYVKVPENHIVIDFDLKDSTGNKSFELNAAAAAKWPETYAELSKSGAGIHLHYIYDGDPNKLSRIYSEGIEIKVFTGNSSLRRMLSKCNGRQIATISTGLPIREDSKVINFEGLQNEKALRTVIANNLQKKYMPGTKPSIDFIEKALNDAYESGMKYDVTDLQRAIISFAGQSSNHADYCLEKALNMKYKSSELPENMNEYKSDQLIFFDVEVFPNLFVVVWKAEGKSCVVMINPTPNDILELSKFKLVGFNNRKYDNHIMYARILGATNEQLFEMSKRIVSGDKEAMIRQAYNFSYTDIYDFSAVKQSLKKFEIELDIPHQECPLPWDQPVPKEKWKMVADYCCNDVMATEAVFNARKGDFIAREILAALAGMTVNDTTNTLTTRIIFGNDKNPKLVYTHLDTGEQE